MKTVRISDQSHQKLTKVAGRLQASTGRGKSLDSALTALTLFDDIFADYEIGLDFQQILYDRNISKEQAFLWFWGISSLAGVIRDCYGFDSIPKYAVAFAAKHFSDQLKRLGSSELDPDMFRYFEKQNETPDIVKKFLKKCGVDGVGNWVRLGDINLNHLKSYFKYIICYEHGEWKEKYIENIRRTLG